MKYYNWDKAAVLCAQIKELMDKREVIQEIMKRSENLHAVIFSDYRLDQIQFEVPVKYKKEITVFCHGVLNSITTEMGHLERELAEL